MNVREYIDTFIDRYNEIIDYAMQVSGEHCIKFFKAMDVCGCKMDNTDEFSVSFFSHILNVNNCLYDGGYDNSMPLDWFESDNYKEVIKRDYNQWLDKNKDKLEKERQKKIEAENKKMNKEYNEYLKLKAKFEVE